METKRVVVKAKKVFSTRIQCTVNGKRVSVTVWDNVYNNTIAEELVKKSFGPGAKDLVISNIELENHF